MGVCIRVGVGVGQVECRGVAGVFVCAGSARQQEMVCLQTMLNRHLSPYLYMCLHFLLPTPPTRASSSTRATNQPTLNRVAVGHKSTTC